MKPIDFMAAIKHHRQQMYKGRDVAVAKCAMEQVEWDSAQSQGTRTPEIPHRFEVVEKWESKTETGDSRQKSPKWVQSSAALAG